MKKHGMRFVLLAITVLTIAGCASGLKFTPIEQIPPQKALVYIYRPSKYMGSALDYYVFANRLPIVKLENGGYYPYYTSPGKLEFAAGETSVIHPKDLNDPAREFFVFEVEAGEIYYLKGTARRGMMIGAPNLQKVEKTVGEKEIVSCKLLKGLERISKPLNVQDTISADPISLARITSDGLHRNSFNIRGSGWVRPPDGLSFEEFIRLIMVEELTAANLYSDNSPRVLKGHIQELDVSTTPGSWTIHMIFNSGSPDSFDVRYIHKFKAGFSGNKAIEAAAEELKPAIREFVGEVIKHPGFQRFLGM
ncbi:DUF2846 domain-containing protein [bacterium]|nr:DUF2846 domain-containing protein [candidate division CSSED10-310 bacterium]